MVNGFKWFNIIQELGLRIAQNMHQVLESTSEPCSGPGSAIKFESVLDPGPEPPAN